MNAARARRQARIVGAQERAVVERDGAVSTLPAPAADAAGMSALQRAVFGLPERQRLVLLLGCYARLDHLGIAEVVGIKPGVVGSTLAEAKAALPSALPGGPGVGDDQALVEMLDRLAPRGLLVPTWDEVVAGVDECGDGRTRAVGDPSGRSSAEQPSGLRHRLGQRLRLVGRRGIIGGGR